MQNIFFKVYNSIRKRQLNFFKQAKVSDKHFTKEDNNQIVNKNKKKCSKSLLIRKMKIKTIMRNHYTPKQVKTRALHIQLPQSCTVLTCTFEAAQRRMKVCVHYLCVFLSSLLLSFLSKSLPLSHHPSLFLSGFNIPLDIL